MISIGSLQINTYIKINARVSHSLTSYTKVRQTSIASIKLKPTLLTSSTIAIHMDCSLPLHFVVNQVVKFRAHSATFLLQHHCPLVSGSSNFAYVSTCGSIHGPRDESQDTQWIARRSSGNTAEVQQLVPQQLPPKHNLPRFLQNPFVGYT